MIPSPDLIEGEIVKVLLVMKGAYEPSGELVKDLQQYVRKMTVLYKNPRAIGFVKELPKTISGKRRGLRIMEFEKVKAIVG